MKTYSIILILCVAILLTACAEQGGPLSKQQVGTVLGGAGGAAVGSQFGKGSGQVATIAVGTLLGAALGSSLGASLDKNDMNYYNNSSQYALENLTTGNTKEWRNPDTGHYGSITPTSTYHAEGQYCRNYHQKIVIEGRTEQAYGKACRQPDGSWKIVENP